MLIHGIMNYSVPTITVTAKGGDSTSGVYSYRFQYKTSSSTSYTTATTKTTTSGTCTYTFTGLTQGTTYNIMVTVTDKAGNNKTGTVTQRTVPLPSGYYYLGGDIDTGVVISDKSGDSMTASGTSSGNQFVWIPVPNSSYLERTEFDASGQPTTGLSSSYTEPYASGYPGEASEYNTMRNQVIKYGGFYIGRYEAGVNSTTLRTKYSTAQTVVSKKGVAPYNYVPWGESMSDASEIAGKSGAVYLAKNKYSHPNSVTSTLPYGCQWDAMCRYIGDSQRTTPEKSAPQLTGSVTSDVSKNIYDLAGNCYEFTMEGCNEGHRVRRGGYYDRSGRVSFRRCQNPYNSVIGDAFRLGLYIK